MDPTLQSFIGAGAGLLAGPAYLLIKAGFRVMFALPSRDMQNVKLNKPKQAAPAPGR